MNRHFIYSRLTRTTRSINPHAVETLHVTFIPNISAKIESAQSLSLNVAIASISIRKAVVFHHLICTSLTRRDTRCFFDQFLFVSLSFCKRVNSQIVNAKKSTQLKCRIALRSSQWLLFLLFHLQAILILLLLVALLLFILGHSNWT